ncbi:lysophospholipid acyltransferase family protein [Pseudodonghicola flavimaris]|uniref:Lysophospholipid acyltransferase family protein n=1 Tax=Pseudodonghicola flavimaris TaxID=3050036 RepID=A0ABT7F7A3_9RHOB|nr:lysophospholipid acyltransferase family protein [Pseudodonghicola flavimaris]MDK3020490.1 lysophospholipid acyltransferase family protein [Pseudodonghicola flavimaris]
MPADPSTLSRGERAKYYATNLLLRGIIGTVMLIPYRWRIPAMGWVVSRLAPITGWAKRVRDNLALVVPDLPEAEVARLCRAVPDNAGRAVIELYSGAAFAERARRAPVKGPGLLALEEARRDNRPVILITGHFGNYDAARANLIGRGHNMGALYRRMANPYFNEHYVHMLGSVGQPIFEQGRRGMMQMVRYLKDGGIIAIVGDLHTHGGESLDFFGEPAVTSVVPAELALKYNAAMIPVYAVRRPNGLDFEIIMHEPIAHSDPITMTKDINADLEKMVRSHMDQWFWIHRRWKPYMPHQDDGGDAG